MKEEEEEEEKEKEEEKEEAEEGEEGRGEDKPPWASALSLRASNTNQADTGVEDTLAHYLSHKQGGELGFHRAPELSQLTTQLFPDVGFSKADHH